MCGNLIPLLQGVLVAARGRQSEPLVRLRIALGDADPAGVQDAEVELAIGDAMVRRLVEPVRCVAVVGWAVDAFGIEHSQVVHRLAITLLGGRKIEVASRGETFPYTNTLFVHATEAELRRREARLGGSLEPGRSLLSVLRNAAAFGIACGYFEGSSWIAGQSRNAQGRSANAGRQSVCSGRSHGVRQDALRQRTGGHRAGNVIGRGSGRGALWAVMGI